MIEHETIAMTLRLFAPAALCGRCLRAPAMNGRYICGQCEDDIKRLDLNRATRHARALKDTAKAEVNRYRMWGSS